MNPGEITMLESKRQALLGQLRSVEASLRGGLQLHGLGAIARAHLERALAHVHEAYIALNEAGRARTVDQLVNDLVQIARYFEEIRREPPPGVTVKSNHH